MREGGRGEGYGPEVRIGCHRPAQKCGAKVNGDAGKPKNRKVRIRNYCAGQPSQLNICIVWSVNIITVLM